MGFDSDHEHASALVGGTRRGPRDNQSVRRSTCDSASRGSWQPKMTFAEEAKMLQSSSSSAMYYVLNGQPMPGEFHALMTRTIRKAVGNIKDNVRSMQSTTIHTRCGEPAFAYKTEIAHGSSVLMHVPAIVDVYGLDCGLWFLDIIPVPTGTFT
eukprot:1802911-Amphidinium_carterae.1